MTQGVALGTSIIRLISNPEDFHGKAVSVVGYFGGCYFENCAIYLRKEDYDQNIYRNGLWIKFLPELETQVKSCFGNYVFVGGVFDAANRGHLGLWSGCIHSVSRCDIHKFGSIVDVDGDDNAKPRVDPFNATLAATKELERKCAALQERVEQMEAKLR